MGTRHEPQSPRDVVASCPYLIGAGFRAAAESLPCLAEAPEAEVCGIVERVFPFRVLHRALLATLCARRLSPAFAQEVSGRLAPEALTLDQRTEVGMWLRSCGCPSWIEWVAPLLDFPPAGLRIDGAGPAALTRANSRLGRRVSPSVFCSDAEILDAASRKATFLVPADVYRLAHREFARSSDDPEKALRLLEWAVACGLVDTTAALFASGVLVPVVASPVVLNAFHSLDWSRFGDVKTSFLARVPPVNGPVDESGVRRFMGLQAWVGGDPFRAADLLEALAPAEGDGDPACDREYLTCVAERGRRPSQLALAVLKRLQTGAPDRPSTRWLTYLVLHSRDDGIKPVWAAEFAGTLPLPSLKDPLFAPVVATLHRQLALATGFDVERARVLDKLNAADPSWRVHLAYPDRDYLAVYEELRRAGLDRVALAVALRKVLLLPVNAAWLEKVLALMVRERRGDLLLDAEDAVPTILGDLVIDVCSKVVEHLERTGLRIAEDEQKALCCGDPVGVVTSLLTLMKDVRAGLRSLDP